MRESCLPGFGRWHPARGEETRGGARGQSQSPLDARASRVWPQPMGSRRPSGQNRQVRRAVEPHVRVDGVVLCLSFGLHGAFQKQMICGIRVRGGITMETRFPDRKISRLCADGMRRAATPVLLMFGLLLGPGCTRETPLPHPEKVVSIPHREPEATETLAARIFIDATSSMRGFVGPILAESTPGSSSASSRSSLLDGRRPLWSAISLVRR